MADFKHYRIYCETEAQWVPEWADTPPTVCPNNPAHTVRADSAAEFQTKLIVLVAESDGQGILGGLDGVGDEMERVIGAARVEKSSAEAVPALTMQCSTGHPTGYGCLQLDMDVDGTALDIDSEATAYPLINLQPITGNSRGDIAFGTARTADPSGPSEGDLWYDSTTEELRFRRSAESVPVRDAISLQGYAVDTVAPTDQYVLAWNNTDSEWQPTDLNDLPGSYADEATSTTTTTTTSGTDVLLSGLTLTPPAGTYWVIASTDLLHSNNGAEIYISIYVDGVQIAHSERMIENPRWTNASWEGFTQALVTVDGTEAIELRWRTNTGTATANNRAIGVMRVS
jgi:hypothetical protein